MSAKQATVYNTIHEHTEKHEYYNTQFLQQSLAPLAGCEQCSHCANDSECHTPKGPNLGCNVSGQGDSMFQGQREICASKFSTVLLLTMMIFVIKNGFQNVPGMSDCTRGYLPFRLTQLTTQSTSVLLSTEWGQLSGQSAGLVIERSRVRTPAGVAGEFSSPGSTFCADSYFGIRSTPVLPQQHVKDPGHSAKSAGGRLQLNMHTPYVCGFA